MVIVEAVVLLAWNMAELWLNTDPGGRLSDYLPVLAGGPVALALWCGLWALGSKLFQHRFEFWPHVRVALVYLLAAGVVGLVLPLLAYALSWEFASRITDLAVGAVLTAMVLAHLSLVLPARKRLLAAPDQASVVAIVFRERDCCLLHRFDSCHMAGREQARNGMISQFLPLLLLLMVQPP